jgi:DNA-binding NarL/FixJ family response regulator
MTIAILDKSEQASLRLGSLISELKCVQNVIQVIDRGQIHEILGKIRPHIVIYDLNGNGSFLTLQKIRKAFPETLIIALTSIHKEQYREKCRDLGILHCLDKVNEFNRIPGIISGIYLNNFKTA